MVTDIAVYLHHTIRLFIYKCIIIYMKSAMSDVLTLNKPIIKFYIEIL